MKILVVICIAALIISLFFPWVSVEGKDVVVSGFYSNGTDAYGMPGIFHLVLALPFLLFILLNRTWSRRAALFFGAFNIAWAVRNFTMISTCSGGTCPIKHTALYVLFVSSILAMVLSFFVKEPKRWDVEVDE